MLTSRAIAKVQEFVETHSLDKGHSLDHFLAVLGHTQKMVLYHRGEPKLTQEQIENLNLAALLHDVDARKFFPDHTDHENAMAILSELLPDEWVRVEEIIHLISMVSTSSNGNVVPVSDANLWMLYPRFADRLEAIGPIGVERCRIYSEHTHRPMFLPTTPRCRTEEELWMVATPLRFQTYLLVKKSESVIDHIYDKLLHIGNPESVKMMDNEYLTRIRLKMLTNR
jgi:uncharacterized protein